MTRDIAVLEKQGDVTVYSLPSIVDTHKGGAFDSAAIIAAATTLIDGATAGEGNTVRFDGDVVWRPGYPPVVVAGDTRLSLHRVPDLRDIYRVLWADKATVQRLSQRLKQRHVVVDMPVPAVAYDSLLRHELISKVCHARFSLSRCPVPYAIRLATVEATARFVTERALPLVAVASEKEKSVTIIKMIET